MQYDLSRSLASKKSYFLNFLAQIEQLIAVAFSIDDFTRLQQVVIKHSIHIPPDVHPFAMIFFFNEVDG